MVKERLFTAKELAFIAAYQGHGDGARAAVAAGYSPKGAAKTALAVAEKQRPGIIMSLAFSSPRRTLASAKKTRRSRS